MLRNIEIIKTYYKEILIFGFAYSCVIIFSLFGPILNIVDTENAFLYSIISLIVFIISFLVNPLNFEKNKKYLIFMWLISIPLLGLFFRLELSGRIIAISIYAFLVARICNRWTVLVCENIDLKYAGRIMSLCFFISFLSLYFVNSISLSLKKSIIMTIPLITSGLMVFFDYKIDDCFTERTKDKKNINKKDLVTFAFLMLVYICGGVSYSGIYPFLYKFYHYDRYYNVLPLVIALPIAGIITDKLGKKVTFALGISFLGISFVFFNLDHNLFVYFAIQTFLQIGWAFINVFGFSYSWEFAKTHKNNRLFGYSIVSIMVGVICGAIIAYNFYIYHISIHIYALVTLIPLFIAMIIFSLMPEKKKPETNNTIDREILYKMDIISKLSDREKEVIYYYYNDKSGNEIAEILHVSPNTIRTHIRNAYKKLGISSKRQLKFKIVKSR